jgi:outer membrane receptor protein involved in Fe transport
MSFGAFAQDSWSIMDRVTLNAGVRYDSQTIYTAQGDVAIAMPNQFAPRLGLIFDPLQNGRSKIFANYAVYYQSVPLRLAYRGGSGEPQANFVAPQSTCNGFDPGARDCINNPANHVPYGFGQSPSDPMRKYLYNGFGRAFVDPDLKPGSSTELSGGVEYEIIPQGRFGATFIHRETNQIIEDMSRDEAATYFIGNPGEGIAKDFPKAKRIYNAGIFQFTKAFSDDWLAQASYTITSLVGNWDGYFRPQTAQLDPATNADFDLRSLIVNRRGPLDGDRRHEIKLYGAKDWQLDQGVRLTTGLSYRARSGGPTSFIGNHVVYGQEVFLLPRGEGERLPWQHNVDLHTALGVWQSKTNSISITADVFNLFNFQAITAQSQSYTLSNVSPITDAGQQSSPYLPGRDKQEINPDFIKGAPGQPAFTAAQRNPNFGQPTAYQDPLTIRIGLRTTF